MTTIRNLLSKIKWYAVSFLVGAGAAVALVFELRSPPVTKPTHRKWEEIEPEEVPEDYETKVQALRDRGLVK